MPRHSSIADHPHRKEIEALIAEGKLTLRQIAARYTGLSSSAVKRYADTRVRPAVRKAAEKQIEKTGEDVVGGIMRQVGRLKDLLDAAIEHLTDPETGRLSFAVDSSHLEVLYDDEVTDDSGKVRAVRRKGTLKELLAGLRGVVSVNVKRDDPRALFVKISQAISVYTDQLARIGGLIKPPSTNVLNVDARRVVVNETSYAIMGELRAALATLPQPIFDQAIEAVSSFFEKRAREAGDGEVEVGAPD